jgi:5-methylthioadenosine/S-adenosylhomocysteine deaminase
MTVTTHIRNIDWLVAWNAAAGRHEYTRGADLVFAGDRITFADKGYDGTADTVVDGARRLVMPGLVNIHNHTNAMPFFKGVREELGSRNFYMSALYDG